MAHKVDIAVCYLHPQTAGGVFLPETKMDKPNEGQVSSLGWLCSFTMQSARRRLRLLSTSHASCSPPDYCVLVR
jgi:co-chaperonin GroES (HSP10)